ncbi:hypothetical protein JCGZ_25880 [Jatropha curcas]|uniref:Glycosyltransferase n=1 Tax=Jatropha curcas TaxID=180498 RepID=A0A067JN70_JATCU|nr:UDP-glycosyltransferase 73C4 [Jatropha curcas]KDP24223.1 hypothetical protein JCGZ_25880 [Jatropha curcas]
MEGEIFVVTGHGHGHLHPCIQLCYRLAKRNFHTTLVISSSLSSAIPSSFIRNPLACVLPIAPSGPLSPQSAHDLHAHLANRCHISDSPRPLCAVVDFQMGWTKVAFWKFGIPVISLFTFGACAAAMEWGAWKVQAGDLLPSEARLVPGLPQEMAITDSDLKRKVFMPAGKGRRGAPRPGDRPPWVPEIEGSIGLIFNTCDDIDGLFIKYMEDQTGLPAWGVGPLLPEIYWGSTSSDSIRDGVIGDHKRESNFTEDEVFRWLESKPRGSVLYVAFGSEVGPTMEEYQQLASGLEESTRPFIWVIQTGKGYDSCGLDLETRAGDRGLIIYGWAPQLLILGHRSAGGFLSHCGWNSTMEAIGVGVPILAWPIRGDQYYNAKLIVSYLKVGYRVADDLAEMVNKDDIVKGIEKIMEDKEMHERVLLIKAKLKDDGFPPSSEAALDAFREFIINPTSN